MFLSRSLNQFFGNVSKKEARNRGEYYTNVDPGTQRMEKRRHFPNPWPEIVECITKTAIRELIYASQPQSTAVNVSHRCQAKWCPDRVPEPPFFTRRGPR